MQRAVNGERRVEGGAWVKCAALGLNARPREGVGRGQRTGGEAGARGTHRGKSTCSKEV